MFENIGTSFIQALGFFAIFGYFVYQTLIANQKNANPRENTTRKKRINDPKIIYKKNNKKGIFSRKLEPIKETNNKRNGLFRKNNELKNNEDITKKKGWFQ